MGGSGCAGGLAGPVSAGLVSSPSFFSFAAASGATEAGGGTVSTGGDYVAHDLAFHQGLLRASHNRI